MLGRKTYTSDELAVARAAVARQLATYDALSARGAIDAADEATYFHAMLLALDRMFVHRVRPVSGKDTNPVTEVEVIAAALIAGEAVLVELKPIVYTPEAAVLGLGIGDALALDRDDFAALAEAFLATIETRFAELPQA
jgi:hypothetical protein